MCTSPALCNPDDAPALPHAQVLLRRVVVTDKVKRLFLLRPEAEGCLISCTVRFYFILTIFGQRANDICWQHLLALSRGPMTNAVACAWPESAVGRIPHGDSECQSDRLLARRSQSFLLFTESQW